MVPEAGYFLMVDMSSVGKKFEGEDEPYDFQFTKWMMREKVIQYHEQLHRYSNNIQIIYKHTHTHTGYCCYSSKRILRT